MEFQWLSHGRAELLPMPLLDVVPPYTIRSRENLLAALRAGARARHLPMHPPIVPPYTFRSPETSFPPLPAPRHTDARPTMPPYTIRSRERDTSQCTSHPACPTHARARPLPRSSPRFARKRGRAPAARGLFYWVQRDKKENNKAPPPHLYLRCSPHPPFLKKK